MQTNRTFHARRFFLGLGALLTFVFAGCQQVAITNLTPGTLPSNPSQIYTITARIAPKDAGYVKDSVRPRIIIDGQSFALRKSPLGQDIFEFDYQVAAGRTELAYYFLINYQVQGGNGILVSREDYTPVQRASIVGRYVLSLEVVRGPVGARVSILGRGFTPTDVVYFEDTPVRTVFESPNSISFFVPPLETNRNYQVKLGSSLGLSPAGTFRIDAVAGTPEAQTEAFGTSPGAPTGPLVVSPASLTLKPGQKVSLTFTTPVAAPPGGTLIDVTTDVPNSVIMPEVIVPAGTNTVTVTVQGGSAGTGTLVARGPGVKELVIPVSVK
ncbi:IPT/TIG domain-containing protein [Nibricoccus sp. IMCC34717]|uniref:IPT/TIG domain-containing protein n=1 Tax=Nibricoccus sp. IMCC34717 TaxID=3034021 RepID=UPI00384C82CA